MFYDPAGGFLRIAFVEPTITIGASPTEQLHHSFPVGEWQTATQSGPFLAPLLFLVFMSNFLWIRRFPLFEFQHLLLMPQRVFTSMFFAPLPGVSLSTLLASAVFFLSSV